MKKSLNLRNGLHVTALMIATWLPFEAQAESGRTLTQLLIEKGVISENEAASLVEETPTGLVELLVAKGVISTDDAASLGAPGQAARASQASSTPATSGTAPATYIVKAREKAVETLTITGRIHGQWDVLSTDYDNGADPRGENNFFMRRLYFGATAQLVDSVSGTYVANFANDAERTGETEKAIIEWGFSDHHTLTAGYEWARFENNLTGSQGEADVDGFRSRLQLLF